MRTWSAIGCMALVCQFGCQTQPVDDAPAEQTPQAATDQQTSLSEEADRAAPMSTDPLPVPPDWVSNPGIGGVLGAVGIASVNELGTRFQLEEARFAARLEIARMLETRIQSVGRDDTEQQLQASRDGDVLRRESNSTHDKAGVDRRITDIVLAGTRQRGLWIDRDTGDLFVWMVVDARVTDAVAHSVEGGVSIFRAISRIEEDYIPPRAEIIVEIEPGAAAAPPVRRPPESAPRTDVQWLESFLQELRTQPLESGDGSTSGATRSFDPDIDDDLSGGG